MSLSTNLANNNSFKKLRNRNWFNLTFVFISTLVILFTLVISTFNFNNFQVKASPVTDANLVIGKVDKGSNFEISVCLQSNAGVMHLADSSTWFSYDTTALTPNNVIVQPGKYTRLNWAAVDSTKFGLSTVFVGDPNNPDPSSTVSTTNPELVGKVAFTKNVSGALSDSIILFKNVFYSTESNTQMLSLSVINRNVDCTVAPTPISQSSSSNSSQPSSNPVSVAQSSASISASSSASSSAPAKPLAVKIIDGKPTLDLNLGSDKTTLNISNANDNVSLFATPLLFTDSTPAANYPIQIKVISPSNSIVIFATTTDGNAKLNVTIKDLQSVPKAVTFLDNILSGLFSPVNVLAANSNITLVSGNPSDLNQTGTYSISLLALNSANGTMIESNVIKIALNNSGLGINTVRSGALPLFALLLLSLIGTGIYLVIARKKAKVKNLKLDI